MRIREVLGQLVQRNGQDDADAHGEERAPLMHVEHGQDEKRDERYCRRGVEPPVDRRQGVLISTRLFASPYEIGPDDGRKNADPAYEERENDPLQVSRGHDERNAQDKT